MKKKIYRRKPLEVVAKRIDSLDDLWSASRWMDGIRVPNVVSMGTQDKAPFMQIFFPEDGVDLTVYVGDYLIQYPYEGDTRGDFKTMSAKQFEYEFEEVKGQ